MSVLDRVRLKFRFSREGTDKTDKSPSVSSVSAIPKEFQFTRTLLSILSVPHLANLNLNGLTRKPLPLGCRDPLCLRSSASWRVRRRACAEARMGRG